MVDTDCLGMYRITVLLLMTQGSKRMLFKLFLVTDLSHLKLIVGCNCGHKYNDISMRLSDRRGHVMEGRI